MEFVDYASEWKSTMNRYGFTTATVDEDIINEIKAKLPITLDIETFPGVSIYHDLGYTMFIT